jgi:DNA-binding transcriptional regulator YdaS (Cro superfamily)
MLAIAINSGDEHLLLTDSVAFAIVRLMRLSDYIKKHGRTALAKAIGSSPAYISQLAHGYRRINAEVAMKIEAATNGEVKCEESCPDAPWHVIRCKKQHTDAA